MGGIQLDEKETSCLANALRERYYRTIDLEELSLINGILEKLGDTPESEFINTKNVIR